MPDAASVRCWLCNDDGCGLCRPIEEIKADIARRIDGDEEEVERVAA